MRNSGTHATLDISTSRPIDYAAAALIVVFAMYVRYLFRDFITSDFNEFTSIW